MFSEIEDDFVYSPLPDGIDPRSTRLELFNIIEDHIQRVSKYQKKAALRMGKPTHKKYVVEKDSSSSEKAEKDRLALQISKLLEDEDKQKKAALIIELMLKGKL